MAHARLAGSYGSSQVCRFAGISFRQLNLWATTGVVSPTIDGIGRGTSRRWLFLDVVGVRAVAQLRLAGFSLQSVRRIQAALRAFVGDDSALRRGALVIEVGSERPDVGLALDDDEVMRLLHAPGQTCARTVFALEPIFDDVTELIRRDELEHAKQVQAA